MKENSIDLRFTKYDPESFRDDFRYTKCDMKPVLHKKLSDNGFSEGVLWTTNFNLPIPITIRAFGFNK